MENPGSIDLREGIAVNLDVDALHNRMQRFNENQTGNGANVQRRQDARVLRNPSTKSDVLYSESVAVSALSFGESMFSRVAPLSSTYDTVVNKGAVSVPNPNPSKSVWTTGGESFVVNDTIPSPTAITTNSYAGMRVNTTSGSTSLAQADGVSKYVLPTEDNGDAIIFNIVPNMGKHEADINTKSTSYAGVAGTSAKDQPKVNSNFRPLVADTVFDGVNISIPRKVVEKVSTRFEHTLYDYFIGKRMAFPVVEYYARNNRPKHGLKRIMMNTKGFFFFKFDTRARLEVVLEGGPWMIRKSPIILKKRSMDTRLLKEELTRIPIWVKLHDIPIQVFEEDGISLIDTFISKPVMLDSYTSSMCNDSCGRSSFARCLIEVNSEADLVDVVTIGIPSLNRDDFTKEIIRVEYE
ncbi:zinc knuckle CX2CX4HX4C containing protein [Tanacetum coccineum]